MKKLRILLLLFFLTLTLNSFTQDNVIIKSLADSLRDIGDLKGAILEYKKIYLNSPSDYYNNYNFACALSIREQNDSCFKYLNEAINKDTNSNALTDPDFLPLRNDKKWLEFENRLIGLLNIKFKNPYKDIEYAKKLWEMQAKDQAYYKEINIVEKKNGKNSTVVKALWILKKIYNEQNLKELELMIEKKGWPKKSEVGGRAAGAAFLIIQHSKCEIQKKYLPIIEKLCKENEANWQNYALMYDRIQTNENRPQKFGSQVKFNFETQKYELFPLLDDTKVDEWRKEVGLDNLSDYLKHWKINFEQKK